MAPEDHSHILPLESFGLSAVPLTTHNIVWSPDAELAIGADDCIYLYLPEFPSSGTTAYGSFRADFETQRQYHEITLRFPTIELRPPELNQPLFDAVGQDFPDFPPAHGAGVTVVANIGSSLNHVVALEWSPNGLGRMQRSVLGVLTGSGALNIYCEGITDGIETTKLKGRNVRGIKSWVVAWGVGGNLLLPRAEGQRSQFSREYITSFAWSREIDGHGALLAYVNDEGEITIVAVQSEHSAVGREGDPGKWRVEEVGRFMGDGPHGKGHPSDPDYTPCGSSFSLRWSPWLHKGFNRICMLSYVTKNYVGFRQITIAGKWKHMETPRVEVQTDSNGICLFLAPDAFVTFEDLVWTIGGSKMCRGIIATPAKVQSFQVALDKAPDKDTIRHETDECDTTYPPQDEIDGASNPITGLIIHPPNLAQSTLSPYFSLTRLSATPNNTNWYQTNLPVPSNIKTPNPKPRWATEISRLTETKLPIPLAHRSAKPDGTGSDDGADDMDDAADGIGDGGIFVDSDDDFDYDSGEEYDKSAFLEQMNNANNYDDVEKIHTTRVRVWGMTASPGGGVTAVFITISSAIKPERTTFGGLRCRVLFGQNLAPIDANLAAVKKLSTEARLWEWMYGGGAPVPGASSPEAGSHAGGQVVRGKFEDIASTKVCVFCRSALKAQGNSSRCPKGHVFQNCAATGIPITEPGTSTTCGVCGRKCLKPEYLQSVASDLISFIKKEISSELCGGCGGKFFN
ncbi:uncharacterized protein BCR38DRAFT_353508 [Pseudomassariella vexata]|uniref:Transcription factor IIIC subunit delta N-term-domain-containing protein n=1 Tax=Pseudomassariella vexata TaxID=1141098 RepID=A0A1Y2DG17_9PEZI|nr:uncharacterized protein BCR38DRAFT_353508 [Pseudomassariella vexata]ORY58208.1 hypothetical protein BCR38DRAFT_353508 [Pseudomassariella vexata]